MRGIVASFSIAHIESVKNKVGNLIMVESEATQTIEAEVDFNATWIGETIRLTTISPAADAKYHQVS